MATHKVKPLLVDSKERTNLYYWEGKLYFTNTPNNISEDAGYNGVPTQWKQLILISLEDEKIEIGDRVYSVLYGLGEIIRDYGGEDSERNRPLIAKFENSEVQQSYHRTGVWQKGKYEDISAHNCKKVIANQNQLSPELIQQLICEYNHSEVRIMKDFEIEISYIPGGRIEAAPDVWKKGYGMQPKLTNGFVTIIEKGQVGILNNPRINGVNPDNPEPLPDYPIIYTEEDLKQFGLFLGRNFKKYKEISIDDIFTEWFNQNKK